jgi:hypothetical protein
MAAVVANNADLGRPTIRSDYSASSFPAVASAQESRRLVKLVPTSGATFTERQFIRFNIPAGANEVLDGVNSYLTFNIEWTETGDHPWEPTEGGAQACFERATMRNNGNVLEDVQYLPHLADFLARTSDPSDGLEIYAQTGQLYKTLITMGQDPLATIGQPRMRYKQTGAASSADAECGHQKFVWAMSELGILNTYQYIPIIYMGNSGIALELVLQVATVGQALRPQTRSAATTLPTAFAVTGVEMFLELVKMRPSWVASGWEHLAANKNIELPMQMWSIQTQSVTTATSQVVRFTSFAQSMKALFAIIKTNTQVADGFDEFDSWYVDMPIRDYQYRLNVDLFPQERIEVHDGTNFTGTWRVFAELQKALRQFADYTRGNFFPPRWTVPVDNTVGLATFAPGRNFLLPIALDTHILGEEDDIISGLNLRDKAAPAEVILNFTVAPVASTMYLVMLRDAKLVISNAGVVTYD